MISEGKDQNSDFENDRIRKNVSQHCENAKERKAHVDKIALYMELSKSLGYFGKLMKPKSERLEMPLTCCMETIRIL